VEPDAMTADLIDQHVDQAYLGVLAGARESREGEEAERAALRRDGYLAACDDLYEIISENTTRSDIVGELLKLRREVIGGADG
jgi:hypothetical protein